MSVKGGVEFRDGRYIITTSDSIMVLSMVQARMLNDFMRRKDWESSIRWVVGDMMFTFEKIDREDFIQQCVDKIQDIWECGKTVDDDDFIDVVTEVADDYGMLD